MSTSSTTKYIKNVLGQLTEETGITVSTGADVSNRIPSLNSLGVLDISITNAKVQSAGATDSGKLPALDASGRLDTTMMPVGVAADTALILSSEALTAGALVNVWNNAGVFSARKADATISGKEAHGFVLTAFGSAVTATVYFIGSNTGVTGLTAGPQYLQTTAGTSASTPPTGSGNIVQRVGVAVSATSLNFAISAPILLA